MNWEMVLVVLCVVILGLWARMTDKLLRKIEALEEQITALNRGLPLDLHKIQERIKELEYQQQPLRDR